MPRKIPIDSIHHIDDTRPNIPTIQQQNFVPDDDKTVKTQLYSRNTDLDPQLVWRGKDEQDLADLEVPTVPIYTQEKIEPQCIIENLRENTEADAQFDLFGDYDGIDWEKSLEFYQHEQNWQNRMILGDSLLVMNSLAEKENLKGKVQMIFLDPPYGIKFGSNWQVSTRKRDVKDGSAADVTRQPEQVKAFRDTWQDGINSYLAYLRDRLRVAHELLTESGSVFIQIGDENVHLVRCLLDEVFGAENFVTEIQFVKTSAATTDLLAGVNDIILWYAKDKELIKYRQLYYKKIAGSAGASGYTKLLLFDGTTRRLTSEEIANLDLLPANSRIFTTDNITSQRPPGDFPVEFQGKKYKPGKGYWKTGEVGFPRLIKSSRVSSTSGDRLSYVRFLDDFPAVSINNVWTDTLGQNQFGGDKVYVVQTAVSVVQRCMLMTTDAGDLVLDPTCGSGTTAFVAEQWGRRWITIDTSRVALALARTRLMSAKFPFYLLADSAEGQKKEVKLTGIVNYETPTNNIRRGFVYERVPHITLKSIANNAEIDEIYSRWQTTLEPMQAELNKLLGKTWQEWEIEREPHNDWTKEARRIHLDYWQARRSRQSEIDASIASRADIEFLFDKPFENKSKIRVSGKFTVESLSPHRVISTDDVEMPQSTREPQTADSGNYIQTILGNLRRAGVQNTVKDERLTFENLHEVAGGIGVHAYGEFIESGQTKSVAIAIAPQYGTVDSELIKSAVKESMDGMGVDLLIICGFAFEGNADDFSKTAARRYGKLTVLNVKMNPDLAMSDDLLKKTGTGNLFMIFGEPDVSIESLPEGKLTVEIKGLDIYNPTTGAISSNSTDEIACWFIDTNYDGQQFFVRHAYFTGAGDPYSKLKIALKADVNADVWATLYRTKSRPFDLPKQGKIAVKIINHFGDEALKVYDVKNLTHTKSNKL